MKSESKNSLRFMFLFNWFGILYSVFIDLIVVGDSGSTLPYTVAYTALRTGSEDIAFPCFQGCWRG